MTAPAYAGSGLVLLLLSVDLVSGGPIRPPESRRDDRRPEAQDFLSQFLSSLNLTEQRPERRPLAERKEPPEYMLELYNRFASDRTAVPSANIVRSFKNEDSSPFGVTAEGARIHPLLFNISVPHREHVTLAELRVFTLVRRARRTHAGVDCRVTVYKIRDGLVWTKEARRRDGEQEVELKDLEELVTKRIRAQDNAWLSFDLTGALALWRKSGCAAHGLGIRFAAPAPDGGPVDIDVGGSREGKHNAVMIVFSDDQSRDHRRDQRELGQIIARENDLPDNVERGQAAPWDHVGHYGDRANQDDVDKQPLVQQQQQSNLIYDTPPRIRRNVKSEPCKRAPLFVDFKEIGWDSWIIQPLGYEAFMCKGVCSLPLTAEVSPTKHAIMQTVLSIKSPERVSRACCVPTKLEPISLLYHDNGVITFNHKYEGMVVAECGCR